MASWILIWIFLVQYYGNKWMRRIKRILIYENGIYIGYSATNDYFIPFDKIKKHKRELIDKARMYFEIESEIYKKIRIGNHSSIKGIDFISKNIGAMDTIIFNNIKKNPPKKLGSPEPAPSR
jgi:hypothetical protein